MAQEVAQTVAVAERDEAMEYAVVALLNAAVVLRSSETSPGIELECKMCGQRDDNHTRSCLVPALEMWLNPV
jgi:hypothetical protein